MLFRVLSFIVGRSNIMEQPLPLKVDHLELLSHGCKNESQVPSGVCLVNKCLNGSNKKNQRIKGNKNVHYIYGS
jgi:hypothetical protein